MWKRLRAIFISGLLAILPLGLTLYLLQLLYSLVSGWLGAGGVLGGLIQGGRFPIPRLPEWSINVLGIVIVLAMVLVIGALTRLYIGRLVYSYFERVLLSIPVLRKIYSAVKQLTDAVFQRDTSMAFKRVVLVEYPSEGLYMVGFLTNRRVPGIEEVLQDNMVSVFLMSPPNPVTGFWLILPEKDVTYLDHITVEEAFRMIMSLGISIPPEVRARASERQAEFLPQDAQERARVQPQTPTEER